MEQNFKCGYCSFLINTQCDNYLEHECFSSFDGDLHDLVSNDSGTLTMVLKGTDTVVSNESLETENSTNCWEETLIKHVQDRPALYDISLPVNQRTNAKKNLLWKEIANKYPGLEVEEIKAKWKYLRDCYIKAKKKVNQYKPSGSAFPGPIEPGFRFYNQMTFLNDSTDRLPTISSVSLSLLSPSTSTASDSEYQISDGALSPTLNKRKPDEKKDLQRGILEALSSPAPTQDGVDGFLLRLGESLRRFPYRERTKLELNIMQLVFETECALSN